MWVTIDKETYMRKVAGLKPLESFTDPDGTMEMSCGKPRIETIWGVPATVANEDGEYEDQHIVKCEMKKKDRHQKYWDIEYFELVNQPAGGASHMIQDPNVKTPEAQEEEQATEGQESAEEGTTEG